MQPVSKEIDLTSYAFIILAFISNRFLSKCLLGFNLPCHQVPRHMSGVQEPNDAFLENH